MVDNCVCIVNNMPQMEPFVQGAQCGSTVQIQIKYRVLQHFIWVFTFCQSTNLQISSQLSVCQRWILSSAADFYPRPTRFWRYSDQPDVRPSIDRNLVNTLWDISIIFGKHVYQGKTACRVQEWLLPLLLVFWVIPLEWSLCAHRLVPLVDKAPLPLRI